MTVFQNGLHMLIFLAEMAIEFENILSISGKIPIIEYIIKTCAYE